MTPLAHRPDDVHQLLDYLPPPDEGLDLLHVDEHLLVIHKPSGLLSVPGRGERMQDCLAHRVQARHPQALIVHRLDMDTSGLIVMAVGPDMQRTLSQQFAQREVDKRYVAVLDGLLVPSSGEVNLPLLTDWPRRPRQKVCHVTGKPSVTRFQVLARDEVACRTRVELEPVTGRTHQLRVHMQALGHPITGDPLYGPPGRLPSADRLLLHASMLSLTHPVSGQRFTWEKRADF